MTQSKRTENQRLEDGVSGVSAWYQLELRWIKAERLSNSISRRAAKRKHHWTKKKKWNIEGKEECKSKLANMENAFMQNSVCKVMMLGSKERLAEGTESGLCSNSSNNQSFSLGVKRGAAVSHTKTQHMTLVDRIHLNFEAKYLKNRYFKDFGYHPFVSVHAVWLLEVP